MSHNLYNNQRKPKNYNLGKLYIASLCYSLLHVYFKIYVAFFMTNRLFGKTIYCSIELHVDMPEWDKIKIFFQTVNYDFHWANKETCSLAFPSTQSTITLEAPTTCKDKIFLLEVKNNNPQNAINSTMVFVPSLPIAYPKRIFLKSIYNYNHSNSRICFLWSPIKEANNKFIKKIELESFFNWLGMKLFIHPLDHQWSIYLWSPIKEANKKFIKKIEQESSFNWLGMELFIHPNNFLDYQ